jgi:hypothetical protein
MGKLTVAFNLMTVGQSQKVFWSEFGRVLPYNTPWFGPKDNFTMAVCSDI